MVRNPPVTACGLRAWAALSSSPDAARQTRSDAPGAKRPAAIVFGCAGFTLTEGERAFFRSVDPLGFILFRRNIDTPDQVRALVRSLRDSVGRADAPVLIDQEGGRVARLGPPHWPAYPPGATFGVLYDLDKALGLKAARLSARLIAADLIDLGITVDCLPLADVPVAGAD